MPRADRDGPHGRRRRHHGDALGSPPARRAPLGGRLRDRVLLAQLPQAVRGRRAEDRPRLRCRPRGREGGRGRGARRRRPRSRPRPRGGRRGRRDDRAAGGAAFARL